MSKNIAIIGAGHWGKNLIRCFNDLNALKGICDIDKLRSKSFLCEYPKLKIYEDINEIIKDKDIDGVVIAVPVENHFNIAKIALESNKDIFVEKPVTTTYDEAEILCKLAKSKNRVFLVGHILEYHPAVVKLREVINAGDIGEVKEVYSSRLNTGRIRQSENVWWSFAPHDIMLMLNTINSQIVNIRCSMADYLNRGISDSTVTTFNFDNKCFGHIHVSWTHPFKVQNFVVIGTLGALEFNDMKKDNKLVLYRHRYIQNGSTADMHKGVIENIQYDTNRKEPLLIECMDFLECIKTRCKPISSGEDGKKVIKILELAVLDARDET